LATISPLTSYLHILPHNPKESETANKHLSTNINLEFPTHFAYPYPTLVIKPGTVKHHGFFQDNPTAAEGHQPAGK
jgi:hypothetical protein